MERSLWDVLPRDVMNEILLLKDDFELKDRKERFSPVLNQLLEDRKSVV